MPTTNINRKSIPVNVKRKLWAESMGYCLNPECKINLFENDCAEEAHIRSVADGGSNSFKNLIILCANCHTKFDKGSGNDLLIKLAPKWKQHRQQCIKDIFYKKYSNFEKLKNKVYPILKRNNQIFMSYGPHTNEIEMHNLWKKFEFEIITNNKKLELLLEKNIGLLHYANKKIVERFIMHSQEFINTREDDIKIRRELFPKEFLSIFGLEEVQDQSIPEVSPLQNFLSLLLREDRYISLNFIKDPTDLTLIYLDEKKVQAKLKLDNLPYMQQLFYSGRFYYPKNQSLRLENLIFFLKWLDRKNIRFNFHKFPDLSRLILNKKYEVQLFYEYLLSLSALQGKESKELICINLYNWNDGPASEECRKYAKNIGMKVFNSNQFYTFAHKNIK